MRFFSFLLCLMLPLLEKIAPSFVAKKAYKALSEPKIKKLRPHEETVLKGARRSKTDFKDFKIARYKWGFGPKHVLLVHGWEGQAGNFAALVPILVDAGYTVHAFDAPSHGKSSTGPTSLFDYSDLVESVLKETQFESIITHSFGSVPLSFALSNLSPYPLKNLLFITSPDTFQDRMQQILDQLKLTSKTADRVIALMKKETGQDPTHMSVTRFCADIHPAQALVVHGENDQVIKREWSEQVANSIKNSEFEIIPETGHYRILFDQNMQERVKQFFS